MKTQQDKPAVFISSGAGPYQNAVRVLKQLDLSAVKSKRVLLKPNAGRKASPDSGIITNPEVVAAAIDVFREAGADVFIGESPILGVKPLEALEASGITAVANERNCPVVDMDIRRFVEIPVPNGTAISSLRVCPEALESDFIVSIPVMKTHMHTT
ncbi:MAG: DUF362 domain-containing protein, partial [Lentisphaerae bacterium]|nr:DUF362 domain-containing protein [Lentisphaerota bacterium]